MKMTSMLAGLLVAASAFATGAQAAPTWTVTMTGTIQDGYDSTGVFGTAGQNLAGLAYKQTITASIDPAQYGESYQDGWLHFMRYSSAPITDTVTINGQAVSFQITNVQFEEQLLGNGLSGGRSNADEIYAGAYGYDSGNTNYLSFSQSAYAFDLNKAFMPSQDFSQALAVSFPPGFDASSYFALGSDANHLVARFHGNADSLVLNAVEAPANVPEPASLALLGLGVAGMGVLRRRRTR